MPLKLLDTKWKSLSLALAWTAIWDIYTELYPVLTTPAKVFSKLTASIDSSYNLRLYYIYAAGIHGIAM